MTDITDYLHHYIFNYIGVLSIVSGFGQIAGASLTSHMDLAVTKFAKDVFTFCSGAYVSSYIICFFLIKKSRVLLSSSCLVDS